MAKIVICVETAHGEYRTGTKSHCYEDKVDEPAIIHPRLGQFVTNWLLEHGCSRATSDEWETAGRIYDRCNPLLIQALEAEAEAMRQAGINTEWNRPQSYSNFKVVEYDETIFSAKVVYQGGSHWNEADSICELTKCEHLVLTPENVQGYLAKLVAAQDMPALLEYLRKTGYAPLMTTGATSDVEEGRDGFDPDVFDSYEEAFDLF